MHEDQSGLKENAKRFSVRLMIIIALFAVVLILFWMLTDEVVFEKENSFDLRVHALLASYANPRLTGIMEFLTFFGSRAFLWPCYGLMVCYYLFVKKDKVNSLSIAAIALSGAGVLFLLKQTFKRHRPLEPLLQNVDGFSYPSGHSFSAFTFCGVVCYLVWISSIKSVYKWILSVLFFCFATSIALSRVYLHVHFATDVIAGFGLSFLWLLSCYFVLHRAGKLTGVSEHTKGRSTQA
ncbi:phosphatase PAP2 family protein [Segetibacter sp. 3557_3]|uniref:phosphatase PAP2 family protein n=1 Tax=Segetibacter sp. 3557_3 TaxID=2547429 RepID=UPI001058D2F6|nr:phosphatase PAP2 family protein [Segetibacter sp. 3557_3]TDH21398.1 phosphatase PAP2 family protein [Segetibacter sp. 3557_3]